MFDVKTYCRELRKLRAPFKCPFEGCEKIFISVLGIKSHICKIHISVHLPRPFFDVDKRKCTAFSSSDVSHSKILQSKDVIQKDPEVFEINLNKESNELNINNSVEIVSEEDYLNDACGILHHKLSDSIHSSKSPSKSSRIIKNTSSTISTSYSQPAFRFVQNYEPLQRFELPSDLVSKDMHKGNHEEGVYDMDLEDMVWLDLANNFLKRQGFEEVSEDTFEGLIKCLEKESYVQHKSSGHDSTLSIDENAFCVICNDGESDDVNAIIFCDNCNLPVHQQCYGVQFIPEGSWLCTKCIHSPSSHVNCVLCPNKDGAFKPTDDKRWAHILCALWIPEVGFKDPTLLEPITFLCNIPQARWRLRCYICKKRNAGACIQCKKKSCCSAFHVTCAQKKGLFMEIKAVATKSGGIEIEKSAFCARHKPESTDKAVSKMNYGEISNTKITEIRKKSPEKSKKKRTVQKSKDVFTPNISPNKLIIIAESLGINVDYTFGERIIEYWKLKRQSRNGLPLVRFSDLVHIDEKPDIETFKNKKDANKELLFHAKKLRQDFEKVRLLLEMVCKREKLKRKLIEQQEAETELRLQPFKHILLEVLENMKKADKFEIFAEPVDCDEVKDYLLFIEQPMDLNTIEANILANQYKTFDDFNSHVNLILNNCTLYNAKDTFHHKYALGIKDKWAQFQEDLRQELGKYDIASSSVLTYDDLHLNSKASIKTDCRKNQDQHESVMSSSVQSPVSHMQSKQLDCCTDNYLQLYWPNNSRQLSSKTRKVQETKENSYADSKQVNEYRPFELLKSHVETSFELPRKAKFTRKSLSIPNLSPYKKSFIQHAVNGAGLSSISRSKVNLLFKQNARSKLPTTNYKTRDMIRSLKKVSRNMESGPSSSHKIKFSKRLSMSNKRQGSCFKSSFRYKHRS